MTFGVGEEADRQAVFGGVARGLEYRRAGGNGTIKQGVDIIADEADDDLAGSRLGRVAIGEQDKVGTSFCCRLIDDFIDLAAIDLSLNTGLARQAEDFFIKGCAGLQVADNQLGEGEILLGRRSLLKIRACWLFGSECPRRRPPVDGCRNCHARKGRYRYRQGCA